MALSVMIVDDEKDIHTYLKQVIDWEGMELRLVCEAENAISAIELFSLHRPQIVFMDVCIPSFDGETGLDLAQELHKIDKDAQVIVITGYADFKYAQQALMVGAVDLLLKPLQPVEVNRSLGKAIVFFEEKKQKLLSQTQLKHIISENADFLRIRKIEQLLGNAECSTKEEIAEQLRLLSLDILGDKYAVVCVTSEGQEIETASDLEIYQAAVKQMCENILLENNYKYYTYYSNQSVLNCIVSWCGETGNSELEAVLQKFSDDVELCFKSKIKLGIGMVISDLAQMSVSAEYARHCLHMENSSERNNQKNELVVLAKKYVRENIADVNLGFDNVCDHIGITKIYFGRLFQKEEGISFGTYINQCRIEQAKSMLEKTNMRVSEVAGAVGFSNTKYFSVVFKSTTGMTPLDYRRSKR